MRPVTETELAEVVRDAPGPLYIRGGGTRGPVAKGVPLDVSGLSGISLYEPGALTLVAGAGTALAEVEAALERERQRLAFEPPDLQRLLGRSGVSTLGGVVAANASGPRRMQSGAARDHMLGIRFVDGSGAIVKSGGRVMKNVTGLDLVKLLAGSHGTLGVISEVALKVQAIPEAEVTLVGALDLEAGLAALRQAMSSPYDVTGAAFVPGIGALIRLEGMAGSVRYRSAALTGRLSGPWEQRSNAGSVALWRDVRDVTVFAGQAGAVWRLSVKPSDALRVTAGLTDLSHQAMFDWGGGLIWVLVPSGASALVRGLIAGRGHATLVRGVPGMEEVPVFQPESAGVAALTAGLRATFDPRGILNKGLMA